MTRRTVLVALMPLVLAAQTAKQDDEAGTTRLTVHVTNERGTPIDRASVVVRFKGEWSVHKFGRMIRTSWELRTNQDGDVQIPPVPQGDILVQVIAKGYQTYGDTLKIEEPTRTVAVKLSKPVKQYSAHDDLVPADAPAKK